MSKMLGVSLALFLDSELDPAHWVEPDPPASFPRPARWVSQLQLWLPDRNSVSTDTGEEHRCYNKRRQPQS